jgi:hypothetical protein
MNRVANKNGVIARRATPVVVIVAPTIRCGEAVWCESGGSDLSRTKGLRPTVSRSLCQGVQHSERPFLLQPVRAPGFAGGLRRAAATRYCAAADCGSSRLQPPPAPDAHAHRVEGATPSEGNNHSRRRLPCIPSRKTGCAVMWGLIRGSLGIFIYRQHG